MLFLLFIKCSPILVLIELNDIDLIENPVFDFNIKEMCLLSNIMGLIIFKSLNKKVGTGFPVPKGSNFFISS